jgi:hypothetical protein
MAANVPGFSALCLFFGERLSDSFNKNRPIGLIDATWGGTRIEAWMSQRVPVYCLTPPNQGYFAFIKMGLAKFSLCA